MSDLGKHRITGYAYKPATKKMEVSVSFWPFVVRKRHSRGIGFRHVSKLVLRNGVSCPTIKTIIASRAQLIPPGIKKSKSTFTQRA